MTAKPFRTHYDNLQVARNASDAVIRAAYRSLAQNYHPDRATGDPQEAQRTMQIINASYEVLANPEAREQHDRWIAEMEEKSKAPPPPVTAPAPPPAPMALVPELAIAPQAEAAVEPAADDRTPSGDTPARTPIRIGTQSEYVSARPTTSFASKVFGWIFVAFIIASLIPLLAQAIYWFRFKVWVALPARLAFGHAGNLPDSVSVVLPDNGLLPFMSDWLYHSAGQGGLHGAVYSFLDSVNISIFYLLLTIVIFFMIQFVKDRFSQ